MSPGTSSRSAIVIGAGFGGLALAIRLQSAGIATTLLEARDKRGHVNIGVRFVDDRYIDGDVRSEHASLSAICRNAVYRSQRI